MLLYLYLDEAGDNTFALYVVSWLFNKFKQF